MPLCKFFPLLLFLTLISLLNNHTVSFSGEEDLTHLCLDSGNYTANDPYDKNLRQLLIYLTAEAPTNGFAMASKGQGQSRIHGLAFCRGDLSPHDCWNCVVRASGDMLTSCPNNKAATIFRENCTIRYSNEDFFGQTTTNTSSSWFCWRTASSGEATTKNAVFGQRVQEFLTQLCEEAGLQTKMYASGMSELDEFHTLYGLAQCSRDLSTIDCMKCLNESVSYVELPQCGKERVGVRVYSESCRVRYELYPFLNDHSHYPIPSHIPLPPSSVPHDAVSPNPAPTSSSDKAFEGSTLIGFSSSSVLLFVITMVW
ncbi:hypothetical protein HN51_035144 [Arachis hypogaea]|uniref:Gnk2-homologous domain-containing protein n=1 Tax=Arachis hypogaea TaxID=3818 RepID=A0A445A5Y5_ARAHY|nr:cysteine-rich repeat secretory protein 38-like [Arachis ipaensis]XP_025637447.1 cysteine-rich repeat secretory protein 38-like [Arachis hypogaea]RYR21752.1 hypothetical protein Ahy_B03g067082 [Arachis hypogaea]